MRKLSILLTILALQGCTAVGFVYDSVRMARFDNNEYAQINSIRTVSNLGAAKCGTAEVVAVVDNLYYKSAELKNYSAAIPRNDETVKMTAELADIVKGLEDRYHSKDPVSPSYCTLKFGLIEKNAVTIQNVIGAKPR